MYSTYIKEVLTTCSRLLFSLVLGYLFVTLCLFGARVSFDSEQSPFVSKDIHIQFPAMPALCLSVIVMRVRLLFEFCYTNFGLKTLSMTEYLNRIRNNI